MVSKAFFMEIQGKKITVLGAERSGIGAAKLLKKLGARPFVSDFAEAGKLTDRIQEMQNEGIDYETGGHSDKVYDAEFCVISPGVPSHAPVVVEMKNRGMEIISELEFAANFCKGKIIGITGTNGKSTTTALVDHLLKAAGYFCVLAGNYGKAFSEVVLDVPEDGFVALEISSFQLDHTYFFAPAVAMILNITPDHLNRYNNSMQEYAEAKFKIFKNFTDSNLLILNYDNEYLQSDKISAKGTVHYFSLTTQLKTGISKFGEELIASVEGKEVFRCSVLDIAIRGEHNHANAMAAIEAVIPFINDTKKIIEGLKSFTGIAHRMEVIRELDGVLYVNDSKATNVDSVWYALRSYDSPIFLILGGIDKGNDYGQIRDLVLNKVKKIYAIGQSAEKIFKYFHHDIKVEIKKTLEECVMAANSEARKDEVVLLSPACASMDMFKNYEHRGEVFRSAVEKLAQ
ncbi:MAG: UDP-N-acetylmuramoyl-L-alanine--D-glutamate ligase [Ignavibacteria bacterium]|nr:UDP-N-acetylmuramoyl-L-alanine--D-glutamate ligase [Ignavibacteria bacterium]